MSAAPQLTLSAPLLDPAQYPGLIPDPAVIRDAWRRRTADRSYHSIESMQSEMEQQALRCIEALVMSSELRVREDHYAPQLSVPRTAVSPPPLQWTPELSFTHHSFGQLCGLTGPQVSARPTYLQQFPVSLARQCLEYGVQHLKAGHRQLLFLIQRPFREEPHQLRAITSADYGRIWNYQVLSALREMTEGSDWIYGELLSSDHDMYCFAQDTHHPIQTGSEQFVRGFMVVNSETGDAAAGLYTFLRSVTHGFRLFFRAETEEHTIRVRHTRNGPQRFQERAFAHLQTYLQEDLRPTQARIEAAQRTLVGQNAAQTTFWLKSKGFPGNQIERGLANASRYGHPLTLWPIICGLSELARTIRFADDKVVLEKKIGSLLQYAAL